MDWVDWVNDGVHGVNWDVDGELVHRVDGVDGEFMDSAFVGSDFTWVLGVELVGIGASSLGAG